jgi:hypothetical protein
MDILKTVSTLKTPLNSFERFRKSRRKRKKHLAWEKNGAVLPMLHYGKYLIVKEYIGMFKPDIFIETGTYNGDMVYDVIPFFRQIYSIELSDFYYEKGCKRFQKHSKVKLLHGQSGIQLPELLNHIDTPCLFWLDAHYSGGKTAKGDLETPIIQEVNCILNHPLADKHVILIDDARCFVGQNDYPKVDSLKEVVLSKFPEWIFHVEKDIIRAHRS